MNNNNSDEQGPVASPCIRRCCLDDEDVCVGCLRHLDEITGWGAASGSERRCILARCQARKAERERRWLKR